jgi:hypothetical protein
MHDLFTDSSMMPGLTMLVGPNRMDVLPSGLRLGVRPFDSHNVTGWPMPIADAFMTENTVLTLSATGTMWSGVFLTGQTDPNGWPNFAADSPDWLLHDTANAWRYCLVGALSEQDPSTFDPASATWFFIGNGPILRVGSPGMAPRRLYLACNRPPVNGLEGGDGSWTVKVRAQVYDAMDLPDCSTTPPMTTPMSVTLCAAARAPLTADDGPAALANNSCAAAHDALTRINALQVSLVTVSALLVADIGVLGVLGGGAIMGISHSAHAWITPVTAAVAALIGAGAGATGSALLALAAQISGLLLALTIGLGTLLAAAAGIAIAAAIAMGTNWAFWAGVLFTIAVGLGLLVALIYVAGQINAAANDMALARSAFDRHLAEWEGNFAAAIRACCISTLSSEEQTPPVCM